MKKEKIDNYCTFLIKKVNIMSYCTTYFVKKNSIPSETEKEKLFLKKNNFTQSLQSKIFLQIASQDKKEMDTMFL